MDHLPQVMKAEVVSLADKLRQEGRKEELKRKNWDTTKNMLQKDFESSMTCEVFGVINEFAEKVRKSMTGS